MFSGGEGGDLNYKRLWLTGVGSKGNINAEDSRWIYCTVVVVTFFSVEP